MLSNGHSFGRKSHDLQNRQCVLSLRLIEVCQEQRYSKLANFVLEVENSLPNLTDQYSSYVVLLAIS